MTATAARAAPSSAAPATASGAAHTTTTAPGSTIPTRHLLIGPSPTSPLVQLSTGGISGARRRRSLHKPLDEVLMVSGYGKKRADWLAGSPWRASPACVVSR